MRKCFLIYEKEANSILSKNGLKYLVAVTPSYRRYAPNNQIVWFVAMFMSRDYDVSYTLALTGIILWWSSNDSIQLQPGEIKLQKPSHTN